jgi:hypothetical protein
MDDEVDAAMTLLSIGDHFYIRGQEGNMIFLNTKDPYKCLVCGTTHDSENPYLFVKDGNRDVHFYCRRAKSHVKIGSLGPLPVVEEEKQDSSEHLTH